MGDQFFSVKLVKRGIRFEISLVFFLSLFSLFVFSLGILGLYIYSTYYLGPIQHQDGLSVELIERIEEIDKRTEEHHKKVDERLLEMESILGHLFRPVEVSSINSAINTRSGITVSEAEYILKSSGLEGMGLYYFQGEWLNGMNLLASMGISWLETGGGRKGFINRENYFGWGAYDSNPNNAHRFESPQHGVLTVTGRIYRNYLDPDGDYYRGPTLRGMNQNYASDKEWANKIVDIINTVFIPRLEEYRSEEYRAGTKESI